MKKLILTLIMLNVCCSLAMAQYNGTPVTLKNVYKDDSEDGDYKVDPLSRPKCCKNK